jgi:hypothetical protein
VSALFSRLFFHSHICCFLPEGFSRFFSLARTVGGAEPRRGRGVAVFAVELGSHLVTTCEVFVFEYERRVLGSCARAKSQISRSMFLAIKRTNFNSAESDSEKPFFITHVPIPSLHARN